MRLRLGAALLLLSTACGPAPVGNSRCTLITSPPPPSASRGIFDQGEPVTFVLLAPWTCADLAGLSVDVAVLDDVNDVVPAQGAVGLTSSALSASVTFTPTRPGRHRLVARFQPNLGTVEADVLVVSARSIDPDAGVLLAPALDTCPTIHLTPGGLAVCLADSVSKVYAGQTEIQQLQVGGSPVMAGGVIWTVSGTPWVEGTQADGGPGFSRADGGMPSLSTVRLMGPTPDDVVVVDSARNLRRVFFFGGGFDSHPLGRAPGTLNPSSSTMGWWRVGDTIMAPESGTVGCGVLDGGTTRFCRVAPSAAAAVEPAGVWYLSNTTSRDAISLARPEGVFELILPLGAVSRQARRGWNNGLVFSHGQPAVDYVATWRDGIVVERLGAPIHSADSEWVYLRSPLRAVRR